jgi:hypothetical protein
MRGQPAQAHARGGVGAGAEGQAGSSRITRVAAAGTSCQLGTIQNSGVMSTGSNCDCVRRTQSCSGTGAPPAPGSRQKVLRGQQRGGFARGGFLREQRHHGGAAQPGAGGGMPGSPNRACSASVSASASSALTLSASSASSASLIGSTPLRGRPGAVQTSRMLLKIELVALDGRRLQPA